MQYIHLWGVFIRPEECMGIMTDLGMGIMAATMVDIMGIMVAPIGDITMDTMGVDIMAEEIMVVEIGDSWVKDYNII